MDCPDTLLYTKDHEWLKIENQIATIGITNYAQNQLGDIVYVELPETGDSIESGKPFGVVESVKAVSDIYAPINGEIIDTNKNIESSPETLNSDPYKEGWIIKVKISNTETSETHLSSEEYLSYIKEEHDKK